MLAANLPVCQYAGMQPGQNNNNSNTGNGSNSVAAGGGLVGGGTSAAAAKNQLEQLNTMREALFSQDGWGCQHVNQDTNWEVPSSPEPTNKDPSAGPPIWKPNINNGTDLWESNLRNGGQPPPQPVQKTPWGHTPSTNLGGTWGEDDDGTDTSNVWTGAPANQAGPQWGQTSGGPGTGGSSNAGATTANAWGDPRDMRPCPIDIRNVDPRELRTPNTDPRDMRGMIDPRDPIRGDPRGISGRLNGTSEMWGQHHPIPPHGQIPLNKMVSTASAAVPPVATGASTNTQWGSAQSVVGPKDMTAVMGSNAGNTGIVSSQVGGGKQPTGWEEPSPPPQRRNIPNYDDGTSLWGQQSRVPGGGSHWKDMSDPMSRNHLIRGAIGNPNVVGGNGGGSNAGVNNSVGVGGPVSGNPGSTNSAPMNSGGGPPGRLGGVPTVGPQLKPDNTMWVHPAAAAAAAAAAQAAAVAANAPRNNGAWGDDHNTGSGPNWGDDKAPGMANLSGAGGGGGSWNDSTAAAAWNKNQNKISVAGGGVGQGGWGDSNDIGNEWGAHNIAKPQAKLVGLNSDMIKSSKQYRMLVETGFKKEDVERALIATNLNVEEAAEILNSRANAIESWRRHDESMALGGFDHSNSGGFPGRFPSANAQPSMPFPPVRNTNILSNMGGNNVGGNPNLAALNNIQPLQVQKYLNQSGPHNVAGPQSAAAVAAFGSNAAAAAAAAAAASHNSGQPTAQQLRMLVQQIQLAVQSGYLSSQILNQPLAPATLVLLNQLLSNIKHLQGAQASLGRGNNASNMQINVTVAKYKQQISNLQSQINAQQAVYVKQQQPQQQSQQQPHPAAAHVSGANVEYLRGQHDAISALQGNFSEINLNKPGGYQGAPNQQSRLNQWKLPVLEKDVPSESTDFSRAPGATAKPSISSSAANNMGSLGLQGDGTWSTGRNIGDGWPDSTNDNENKDWPVAQPSAATAFTDLVPEFEPGKPWKGSQIKSIEDDPSITPGSVARSPLSINPTPKEADIFANTSKNSPTDLPPLSLTSSTWSFNPSTSNQNFPSWSDNVSQQSELWPMNKSSRGPPPGLGTNKTSGGGVNVSVASVTNPSAVTGSSNGWIGSGLGGRVPSANSNWTATNSSWNSNWLLLKNLTTQIDGSTLRTLCMQHGPLINFHLYLNQGIALCKYATREEANKAQMTLNNCVLGNTTICAESPNETEVQSILQHLPPSVGQANVPVSGVSVSGGGSNGGVVGGGNGVSSNVANVVGGVNNSGPNGPGNNNNGNNSSVGGGNGTNNPQNSGNNSVGGGGGSVVSSGGNGTSSAWRQQNPQNQSRPTGTDAWGNGSVWQQTANTSASLWTPLDGTTERGTPSNLKSYLPENLLELN